MSGLVPDGAVKKVLDEKLEKDPDSCPICNGTIDIGPSLQYDRRCWDCKTRFKVDRNGEDGRPIPSIIMETTPVQRLKQEIRQKVTEKAVYEQLDS